MREKIAPVLITPTVLILFISILTWFGTSCWGEIRDYREEKIKPKTGIKMSSIQIVADFQYFKDCLLGITYYTGSTLGGISGQPSEISEFVSNGSDFSCIEKAINKKCIFVRDLITVK